VFNERSTTFPNGVETDAGGQEMLEVERIGIPVKAVVFGNSHAVLHTSPDGQPGMFYTPYYSTTGSALVGYHPGTGEFVEARLGSSGGYGCCVGSDGAIYVGGVSPGNLFRYTPWDGCVEDLGGAQFGATYVWAAAASPDGCVYGACYPTCSVIEYDIEKRRLRDLGRIDPEEQYVRSICVDHRGKVWAGVGTHGRLVVLDPAAGERHNVLPERYLLNSTCYDLNVSETHVLCSLVGRDCRLLVYDARSEALVRDLDHPPDAVMWMNTRGAPAGQAYLCAVPSGDLYRYDIGRDALTLLARRLGQCELVVGERYVHGIDDQDYFLYDLSTDSRLDRRRLTEAGNGMGIFTLAGHSDGKIYGSTYINQHAFSYDPRDGELRDLGKVIRCGGQVDSICSGPDGRIYMGCYSLAYLAVYDPARPWQPGLAPDSNPRELGRLGQGQYRTRAIALGPDGRIWVGSVPSYNSGPSGGFSVWDPETGEHRTWLDLVPDGAVHDIAVDSRYLYCSGGGRFFVWDPGTESKVFEEDRQVFSLAVVAEGVVVGNSGAAMFVFDRETLSVSKTFPSPIGQMDAMTAAPNGKAYGINADAVAEIEPGSWRARQIADEGGKFLAADGESVLYFARGSELYRLR